MNTFRIGEASLLPRAHMREAGLSNRFLSVCHLFVCLKKIEISPQKLLCVYLTEVKALYIGYFLLFITIHNIGSTSL